MSKKLFLKIRAMQKEADAAKVDYWKRYEELSDGGRFAAFKEQLVEEIMR